MFIFIWIYISVLSSLDKLLKSYQIATETKINRIRQRKG